MITFHLNADDLSHLRFAFSPLWELIASYWALTNPSLQAVHLPWIHEASAALKGVELAYLRTLITPNGHFANFLTPSPQTPRPDFEDELARLRQTPLDQIMKDVNNLPIKSGLVSHFLETPAEALDGLVAEIRLYWERTLAQHWARIHAVLESDVIYRARQLALDGPEHLFNDLHHGMHYADRTLRIEARHDYELTPAGRGLMLVPLVFMWNDLVLPDEAGPEVPVIAYGARGAGLWTHEPEVPAAALAAAFGDGRAAVLAQMTTPRSTSELAERLKVTPGNISLHIARLREAGLVESQQVGRWVFHRLTLRGERLLALFDS